MGHGIPEFPAFKLLDIADRDEVERLTRRYPPYSDFNFVSMYCYDTTGDCRVSLLSGNLVVRFRDYVTLEPFYSFLGTHRVLDTVERLLEQANRESIAPMLRLVPATVVEGANGQLNGLSVSEDPDSADYIIAAHELIELTSGRWRSKRKSANRFRRKHPHCAIREMDLANDITQGQVRGLFETWADKRRKPSSETRNEFAALERIMRHSRRFNLLSVGAHLDGRLIGFTINEAVHAGHYMGHFGKADPDYAGISVVLESETAKGMARLGYSQMNYQQDLGLDGLRCYKRSWRPVHCLHKVTIAGASSRDVTQSTPTAEVAHATCIDEAHAP